MNKFDFSGYATRNDLRCGDGKIIRKNAFLDCDGKEVPLVWNHDHENPDAVLGHALLENRDDGVYAYCSFNSTENGELGRKLVEHGDVRSLSIYANHLKKVGDDIIHGMIREVSLVLAGANPGAYIDYVLAHSDDNTSDEDVLYANYDEPTLVINHSDSENKEKETEVKMEEKKTEEVKTEKKPAEEKTVGDVLDTLNEEQRNVVMSLIGAALEEGEKNNSKGENATMSHNIFEGEKTEEVLQHADYDLIIKDAKRCGSMRESYIQHADEGTEIPYGIDNLDFLFPEAKNLSNVPEFIKNTPDEWVQKVMNGVHHSPFSRVKSIFADITEDEARAKGYIKGHLKKEEVFSLLKRTTAPTTVYKKQKMDRDDIIDITDMDVVAFIKREMRIQLDEEIARAILLSDGRLSSSDDKIDENCIRPIVNDAALFVIRWAVGEGTEDDDLQKNFIRAAVKSRKNYKGSGRPTMFIREDMLTDCLLLEDGIGHKLYKTEAELATAMRVSEIVPVSYLDSATDKDGREVYAIIVNLNDYQVGADKGGAINMFDDFDIDYNQQKYLIETRCSGSLIKPFSAIVLRSGETTESEEPTKQEAMAPYKAK